MSESVSIDEGWEEPLDSEQVTRVKGEAVTSAAASGEWLVNVSEQVVVPMSTTDVVEALRSRRLSDRSLVWRAGMQDWSPLAEVPPLRLAAGKLAAPQHPPAERAAAARPERASAPPPERALHPPPKDPARAARDERRRNTLPFGFPVVRDPATIREPAGLHPASAPLAAPPQPEPAKPTDDSGALAIYERAAPSLTFSDSVRAEWQGTGNLVHQPVPSAAPPVTRPSAPPPVIARPSAPSAPPPVIARPSAAHRVPKSDPKPRLSLEPQSNPKPRLSLEPQSDPMQSRRAEPERKLSGYQPTSSLAPTTSEPEHELPARGAGLWGDLSVVLASDLRAAQSNSKRVALIASLGSAALASLLTLWFAHSATRHAPAVAAASQPAAAHATAEPAAVAPVAAPEAAPAPPSATSAPSTTSTPSAHAVAPSAHIVAPSSAAVFTHAAPKPVVSAPPRAVVARPKPTPASAPDPDTSGTDNPYAEAPEHSPPKMPTAAFKEASASTAPSTDSPAPTVPSGLEDNAKSVRPAATAAPGF